MRIHDLQILTHGAMLFTSDSRFSSEYPYGGHLSWGLEIKDIRPSDSGRYECQVMTVFNGYIHKYDLYSKWMLIDSIISAAGECRPKDKAGSDIGSARTTAIGHAVRPGHGHSGPQGGGGQSGNGGGVQLFRAPPLQYKR